MNTNLNEVLTPALLAALSPEGLREGFAPVIDREGLSVEGEASPALVLLDSAGERLSCRGAEAVARVLWSRTGDDEADDVARALVREAELDADLAAQASASPEA